MMFGWLICVFKPHEFKDTLCQRGWPSRGWVRVVCGRCGQIAKSRVGQGVNRYANEQIMSATGEDE